MAERELSILVKAKGALKAAGDIGKVDSAVGNLGRTASRGVATAAGNIAKVGVVAGAGIVLAVKGGLQDLAELETAITSVDGSISQMGLSGQITGAQVASWANDIERDIGAAFDDKEITAAATTLLRFGKVTPKNLQPAMVVMTDLAAKTGSVDSAAELLAKALADPTKAAGKLARQGIILTKTQQDQIKAMVKAGDVAGAQALLLDEVAKSTKGAAEASQGPYQRSLSVLADVTEDARKALAVGFLPVIEKVADLLSTELAKPGTMDNIKKFGEGLAGGLSSLIDIAKNLPWSSIGSALQLGGAGAKAVLDAFVAMPAWVQTAVITGWGLNKLTGGAVGSIVGQLASGLIKGVLGIQAGVVNVTGGVVNGGGVGGPAATAGKGGGLAGAAVGLLGWVGIGAIAVGVGQALADAMGATPENPVSGASRAFYRDENRPTMPQETPAQREARDILSKISTKAQRDGEIGRTQSLKIDTTNATLERIRAAISSGLSPTVNVTVPVTIRSVEQKTKISAKLGYVSS